MLGFVENIQEHYQSLDLDQGRHSVGPALGPNCLHRLSAENKSLLASKELSLPC